MFLDLDFTVFDGADLPAEAPGLVLPDVRVGGGFSTEINIINPGDVDADIELQLSGEESEESSRQLLIPSHGVQRLNVAELFGLGDSAETRFFYMTATANPDIACFELVKGPGDLLGLNAGTHRRAGEPNLVSPDGSPGRPRVSPYAFEPIRGMRSSSQSKRTGRMELSTTSRIC